MTQSPGSTLPYSWQDAVADLCGFHLVAAPLWLLEALAYPWFGWELALGTHPETSKALSGFPELCPRAVQALRYVTATPRLSHGDLSAGSSLGGSLTM